MAYLGSWKIDDLLTFPAITHRFDTGALTDADAVPAYRVYEDETGTAILTGSMAKLDDANTTGFYSEQLTLSAANGFEKGKCYTVYVSAAVNSVTGGQHHTFQIEAEVDANTVSPTVVAANVTQFGGSAGTFSGGRPEVNLSHVAGSAVSTTTAQIGVNVVQISTDATAADNAEAFFDGTGYAGTGNTIPTVTTVNGLAANTLTATAIAADAITAAKIADGAIDAATFASDALARLGVVDAGTAQSATGTTLVLRAAAAFADDELIGATVLITGGTTGVGQARTITDYTGATDTATVDAWTTTPSGTVTYVVFGTPPAAASSAPTAAQVADAVWDEARSGHTTAGTFGEYTNADMVKISGDTTAADTLETYTDGTDRMPVDVQEINSTVVNGNGAGTPWGP